MTSIGLLHPGTFGAAFGASLRSGGHQVNWCSTGRSAATRERAEAAGLVDCGSYETLRDRCDIIFSLCPSDAASDVARSVRGFQGVFVEANAISLKRLRVIAKFLETDGATVVDGGVLGPPPGAPDIEENYRFLLAGPSTELVEDILSSTSINTVVLASKLGAASAVKLSWSSWMKGSSALLLTTRAAARHYKVEDCLLAEWDRGIPGLVERSAEAEAVARAKGWRWSAELDEIADMFEEADLPGGFHRSAADHFAKMIKQHGEPSNLRSPAS